MSFFRDIRETFRDHARDEFCAGLQSMGINAQMAERGRAEENIARVFVYKSLGLIDIPEGPISWVNVVTDWFLSKFLVAPTPITYISKYGVPDTRLGPKSPKVKIKSFRTAASPLLGRVADLYWWGKDFGLGIIDRQEASPYLTAKLGARKNEAGVCPPM